MTKAEALAYRTRLLVLWLRGNFTGFPQEIELLLRDVESALKQFKLDEVVAMPSDEDPFFRANRLEAGDEFTRWKLLDLDDK